MRISRAKGVFEKGYTNNWSEEYFIIHDRLSRSPPVYVLKDLNNKILKGVFYEDQLQAIHPNQIYPIAEVLQRKGRRALVSWRGWPSPNFDFWVPLAYNRYNGFLCVFTQQYRFSSRQQITQIRNKREVSLEGELECALKEIHYPRTWASLFPHECTFVVDREEWGSAWEERRIETGYYFFPRELVNTINNAIQLDGVHFSYSETAQRVIVEIPPDCRIHFIEPLSSMLGLGHGNTMCESSMESGKFPIYLSRGIDSLYIYTDAVQTKLVGDTSVPLLRVVPVHVSYGSMVFKEYSSPVYSPLSKNMFSTI